MEVKEPVRYQLPINKWPESDQPREKLIKYGAFKLTDSELVAIILRTGSHTMSAIDLARTLLQKAGGLDQLARLTTEEILEMNIRGIGQTKAVTICATAQLARRIHANQSNSKRKIITSSNEIATLYQPKLQDLKKEIFIALYLDTANMIISDSIISEGTINGTSVTPREVFHDAIKVLAASVIIIHNHPSGNTRPSQEDKMITQKMVEAGKNICINVLDHIIIGYNSYYSFADAGLID